MINIRYLKKLTLAGLLGLNALFPFQTLAGAFTDFSSDHTCGKYVQAIEGRTSESYDLYVRGFVTGTNFLRSRVSPNDFAGYRVWLKTYCQQNPFDSFTQALMRLDYSLGEGQQHLIGNPAKKNDEKK